MDFDDFSKIYTKIMQLGLAALELWTRSHLPAAAQNLHFAAKLQ